MRTLAPFGGAYTIEECPENMWKDRATSKCVVVLALSRGIPFNVHESLVSFFAHNPWAKEVLCYVETAGEQAMSADDAAAIIGKAALAADAQRGLTIRTCACERVTDQPRPFVGPKVCTYTAATRYNARTFLFLDLDLWYFDSLLHLIPRASHGNILCVQERGTSSLYHEMFYKSGIYNGDEYDLKKYEYFKDYRGISYPMSDRNFAINTGLLVVSQNVLLQVQQVLYRDSFSTFSEWMQEKKDAFTGNREQALFNLALIQTEANIVFLTDSWNFQLVQGTRLTLRSDGRFYGQAGSELIRVLHFNGFAAPTGPAHRAHTEYSNIPGVREAARLPRPMNTLADHWPKV